MYVVHVGTTSTPLGNYVIVDRDARRPCRSDPSRRSALSQLGRQSPADQVCMSWMVPMGELSGGYVNAVVRVGETVRRTVPERAEFVHALLLYLEDCGWPGAPRFLGIDESDRQMLSYLPGHVAWLAPGRVDPPRSVVRAVACTGGRTRTGAA